MPPSARLHRWSSAVGFPCPQRLAPTAWTRVPVLLGGRAQATVVEVSVDGVVLAPFDEPWPAPAHGPAGEHPGAAAVVVTVPFGGTHELHGMVVPEPAGSIVVTWTDPADELLADLADYLLLTGDVTPAQLRAAGLPVRTAGHAVRIGEASWPADAEEILALRLRTHQHEGHMLGLTTADLRSSFDVHARHVVGRHAGRIVGYVRLTTVDGDPARSQYVTWSGHEIPAYLWEEGFVEANAGAVDPDYQGAGVFVPLAQRSVEVAAGMGAPHLLAACPDGYLPMYRAMGFEPLESRVVEPRPGWRFRALLIVLDLVALVAGRREGRLVPALREAALLASSRRP